MGFIGIGLYWIVLRVSPPQTHPSARAFGKGKEIFSLPFFLTFLFVGEEGEMGWV